VAGSCKYGDENEAFVKGGKKYLRLLSNCWLLKNFAAWSSQESHYLAFILDINLPKRRKKRSVTSKNNRIFNPTDVGTTNFASYELLI
jgi:hypothetical protein